VRRRALACRRGSRHADFKRLEQGELPELTESSSLGRIEQVFQTDMHAKQVRDCGPRRAPSCSRPRHRPRSHRRARSRSRPPPCSPGSDCPGQRHLANRPPPTKMLANAS
jgi:hypothetical protein